MLEALSLFIGSFADALIGPNLLVPGEPFMLAAGYQLYGGSILGVLMVMAGGLLGDQISFVIGRRYGRNVRRFIVSKRPALRRRIAQGKLLLRKNERKVLVSARLMGPVAWVVPFLAGTGGTSWKRFSIYSSVGLVIGIGQFVFWGYALAAGVNTVPVFEEIRVFLAEHSLLLLLVGGVLLFYLLARRRRNRASELKALTLFLSGLALLNYNGFFQQSDDFAQESNPAQVSNASDMEFKVYAGKSSYFKAQAVNILYVGNSPEPLMEELGWIKNRTFSRDEISFSGYLKLLKERTPPVSDLYWNGQPQWMAFQEPGTLKERNHIRWWPAQVPDISTDETVWLGAVSYDNGLKIAAHSGLITLLHKIEPDVDRQRDKLAANIAGNSKWQARFKPMATPVAMDDSHDYYTDGDILIVRPNLLLAAEI